MSGSTLPLPHPRPRRPRPVMATSARRWCVGAVLALPALAGPLLGPLAHAASGPAGMEPDDRRAEVARIAEAYRRLPFEALERDGEIADPPVPGAEPIPRPVSGEALEAFMIAGSEALVADLDLEAWSAADLAALAESLVLTHAATGRERVLARLAELSEPTPDSSNEAPPRAAWVEHDAEPAIVALLEVMLLRSAAVEGEADAARAERRADARRRALAHPGLARGLRAFTRPTMALAPVLAPTDEAVLAAAGRFDDDLPPEVTAQLLSRLHRDLRARFGGERPEEIERLRRRFVRLVADAMNEAADDAPHRRALEAVLPPDLRAGQDTAIDDDAIERHRRRMLADLDRALDALVSPRARGTLEGGPFDAIDLAFGSRPSPGGRERIDRFGPTPDRPYAVMALRLSDLDGGRRRGPRIDPSVLAAFRDRFKARGLETALLVIDDASRRGWSLPELDREPPSPPARLDAALDELGFDALAGFVTPGDLDGTPFERLGRITIVTGDGRVVLADLLPRPDEATFRRIEEAFTAQAWPPAPAGPPRNG